VEIVQVVFEADASRADAMWVVNAGDDATTLFLRREALYENVNRARHEQFLRALGVADRVRFPSARLGPMHEAAVEMTGINQWHSVVLCLAN